MKAEILATGDEIRTGALVDSNSAWIADRLELAGIDVLRHVAVGDDLPVLIETFKEMSARADVVLVTGGLGPTTDDLSAEAAAKAAGTELALDEQALREIEAFFKLLDRPMTDSNRKQAYLPKTAERLPNPVGTAPGFTLEIDGCRFFFMPGVPSEMKRMLNDQVLPRIEKIRGGERRFNLIRTISTFGSTESKIGELVADIPQAVEGVKLGLRSHFPEIQVKFYASGTDEKEITKLLDRAADEALARIGRWAFSEGGEPMESVVGELLRSEGATLALAESCTGGLLAHMVTNVSGSSDYFRFSGVTYSNEAKEAVLGVSKETLERHGAVHEETAKEMAAGARRVAGATYAISTTGIAGPTGGSQEKPVGTVCIGVATPAGAEAHRYVFPFRDRDRNKMLFAMTALDLLRRKLLGLEPVSLSRMPPKK